MELLIYKNFDLFKTMKGTGLIKRFNSAVITCNSKTRLSKKIFEILKDKNIRKAEFAFI